MIHILLPLSALLWMISAWVFNNPSLSRSSAAFLICFVSAWSGSIAIVAWLSVVICGAV